MGLLRNAACGMWNEGSKTDIRNIKVAMGEGIITRAPHIIQARGLGSCVVVILYDTQRKIGGLAHIMLPDSSSIQNSKSKMGGSVIQNQIFCYADTAIATVVNGLQGEGSTLQDITAKMAGGARMFSDYQRSDMGIGDQNIQSVRQNLVKAGISLINEDVGGRYGRNVIFHLDTGAVVITAIGKKDKEL